MKFIIYSLIPFLIYINIFVAFGAFSLYKVTEIIFTFHNPTIGAFIFFSTLFAYNYMRIIHTLSIKKKNFLSIYNYLDIIYIILFISGLISGYLLFSLGWSFVLLVLPAVIISLLYPISFQINNKSYGLRSIPFLKIFLIGLVWSYMTVCVPLLYESFNLDYLFLDYFFQRFLFVIAISIPFDIRDVSIDTISTLPNQIGLYNSKLFAWFCLFVIDLLLVIDLINHHISAPLFFALFLSIEIASIIIYYTNSNRSNLFYGLIVEGLSIIMCLFVMLFTFF